GLLLGGGLRLRLVVVLAAASGEREREDGGTGHRSLHLRESHVCPDGRGPGVPRSDRGSLRPRSLGCVGSWLSSLSTGTRPVTARPREPRFALLRPARYGSSHRRGVEQFGQLAGLITRRSQVQILP